MPLPRRRSTPQELAAVLQRLEGLRVVPTAPGWVPPEPPPAAHADAEFEGDLDERFDPQARPSPPPRTATPPGGGLFAAITAAWRARAFDPGRRGLAVLATLALAGAAGGAWYFVTARPAETATAVTNESSPTTRPSGPSPIADRPPGAVEATVSGWPTPTPSASTAEPIVVDVVGKVADPGVVELPAGARIRDAVQAAGGALPGTDLTPLDLASRLSDGQEIFVGIPPPSGAAGQAAGGVIGGDPASSDTAAGGSSASVIVDVNTATLAELQTLPGVGPVLAQHILDWRTQHGRFTAVTQLQQVSGIGPSKYAALAGRVRV